MKTGQLEHAFARLATMSVDIHAYTGDYEQVAFEMTTADTFIAGAACTLLDNQTLPYETRIMLDKEFELQGSRWKTDTGQLIDLSPHPELPEYARLIGAVRRACLTHRRFSNDVNHDA